ncbi:hypothetical protein ACP70R_028512 [Stipagrostis hirtigluma subsp. patula]
MESQERSPKQADKKKEAEQLQKKERLLDFLRATPNSKELWLRRLRAPHALRRRVATLRARSATHVSASARYFLRAPAFARTVDWRALRARCAAWARRPANAALLVWLAFVAAGVAFVFLLMTGALNSAVPDAARRRRWTEVANQVLNALFTVMCVYQHPQLCHHLVLLLRWRAADAAELRGVYCKNAGGGLPRERLHVAAVVLLLHATCFAQYAYCALFWLFSGDTRPDWAVDLCMALGLGAPAAAALYMVYGPLGRKIVLPPASIDDDEETTAAAEVQDDEAASLKEARAAVTEPEWAGGLFDLADDPTVAALSLSCTFCVFGWNMERLGLGNMYVHVFTFALLCAAPVLVFAVAALNVHDATLGYLVGAAGALLSVLGLMYGGFWRAQMRRRFGLPADRSMRVCGGRPAMADYVKWLLCAPCALAQEVRTANLYDVEEGNLYVREGVDDVSPEEKPTMPPLEREGCVAPLTTGAGGVGRVVAVETPPVPVRVQEVNT